MFENCFKMFPQIQTALAWSGDLFCFFVFCVLLTAYVFIDFFDEFLFFSVDGFFFLFYSTLKNTKPCNWIHDNFFFFFEHTLIPVTRIYSRFGRI